MIDLTDLETYAQIPATHVRWIVAYSGRPLAQFDTEWEALDFANFLKAEKERSPEMFSLIVDPPA